MTSAPASPAPLWAGKKFNFGFPSFTRYDFTDRQLTCTTGILALKDEKIRLDRIVDVSIYLPLLGRLLNYGFVKLYSLDSTSPTFTLVRIRDARKVANLLIDISTRTKDQLRLVEFGHAGSEVLSQ